MRKNFGVKTFLYPQPVMIIATYDKDGNPDCMNAAWGGIAGENRIAIDLGHHKTTENIAVNRCFTVSPATEKYCTECDYVGIESGLKCNDKMKKSGLTVTKSENINAPVINELPVCIECKLIKIVEDSIYIGEIVNVNCDTAYLGEDGLPDLSLIKPISFEGIHLKYISYGDVTGNAFSDGKKLI